MRLSLQNKEMRKEARRNYEATTKQLRSKARERVQQHVSSVNPDVSFESQGIER